MTITGINSTHQNERVIIEELVVENFDASSTSVTATGGATETLADWMAKFTDRSAIVGNAHTFFNPDYFGIPATGTSVEFNRVRVGDFGDQGFNRTVNSPPDHTTNPSWVEAIWPYTSVAAQMAVSSTIGGLAISAYASSSSYNGWVSGATGGAQAVSAFVINDGVQGHPIVCGVQASANHNATNGGISEAIEATVGSKLPPTTVSPYVGAPGSGGGGTGSTVGIGITGGYPNGTDWPEKLSAALCLGTSRINTDTGTKTALFRKGIVVSVDLDPTTDTLGPIAMEMASGQMLRWVNAVNTEARVYSDSAGLIVDGQRLTKRSDGDVSIFNVQNSTTGYTATNGMYWGYVNATVSAFFVNREAGSLSVGTNNAVGLVFNSSNIATFTNAPVMPAATTANGSIRLPHGTAPSAPINGEMWTTTAGLFVRINGVTKTVTLT